MIYNLEPVIEEVKFNFGGRIPRIIGKLLETIEASSVGSIDEVISVWSKISNDCVLNGHSAEVVSIVDHLLNSIKYDTELKGINKLFHGTSLFQVYDSLRNRNGLFGSHDKTWFYTKRKYAREYAISHDGNKISVADIPLDHSLIEMMGGFEVYQEFLDSEVQEEPEEVSKLRTKQLILVFVKEKLPEVRFDQIVEGKVEYACKGSVPLHALTEGSKQEVVRDLSLNEVDIELKLLYSSSNSCA